MGKLIVSLAFVTGVLFLAGKFPVVAVTVTAISIVFLFKAGEWFNN